jgi:hypothetical protein
MMVATIRRAMESAVLAQSANVTDVASDMNLA